MEKAVRVDRSLPLGRLFSHLSRGHTLVRAWMDYKLGDVSADGLVLDFGGGGSKNHERMKLGPRARVLTTDIRLDGGPTFVCDGEAGLPLQEGCLDAVLLLNVLEHIYNYPRILAEVGRALKPGGVLYLFVPFLFPRHTARYPAFFVDDYFRFGPETLRRLLKETGGFRGPCALDVCDYGPFTASATVLATALPGRWPRLGLYAAGLAADRVLRWVKGSGREAVAVTEWPLGYWVRAVK